MILDSGERTEYPSGAVRDCKEGKGRVDLMPLDVIGELLNDDFLKHMHEFQIKQTDTLHLYKILKEFAYILDKDEKFVDDDEKELANMILEVSKHFEDGAMKYGENNWGKSEGKYIPIKSYIDSACRHYLKYLRGDTNESHNRACLWNVICCIWTVNYLESEKDKAIKPF